MSLPGHMEQPGCGETHCHIHHLDEPGEGAYRRCFECGHVYRSAEELQREWTAGAPSDLAGRMTPPAVSQIFFCPLCSHDW
jgi:hypothetical protein